MGARIQDRPGDRLGCGVLRSPLPSGLGPLRRLGTLTFCELPGGPLQPQCLPVLASQSPGLSLDGPHLPITRLPATMGREGGGCTNKTS